MRTCTVIRDDGSTVPASLIRMGPKNSRVSFNVGDCSTSELIATERIFEILDAPAPKPKTSKPMLDLTTRVMELDAEMEQLLTAAGVNAARDMKLQDRFETLRGLRDDKLVIIRGEVWSREEAEAAGAIEPEDERTEDEEESRSAA